MKQNFVRPFFDGIAKITENDNATSLVEFFKLFLLEIFNFIRYANYTTYDITVHNNPSKIIRNSQRDQYIPHKSPDTKWLIVVNTRTTHF